ncbi:hypothetical protein HDU83_006742 [Entophlyctis luteolus]|nr:hypothetical protein HDU83_006742 [Entophlyctis luteolus]KAJ3391952.1 hypothetical protein HDU84_005100 [Entophlyctis sp. JEL0112]
MLAVSKDCSNGICGANTNSSTVLIDCVGKSMNCTAQIPIYTDYLMTCSQRLETSSTAILDSDISVLIDPANVTVNGSVPSVTWDVKITDTSNVNTTLIVNCTIFAAWATRTENSESGTLDKQLVTVYDSVAAATDPSTRDSNSFNYQANCGKLAAPLCQLYILGQVMNAPWNGINTVSGFASWGLNMLSIPVLKNTTASSNQKAADLEASMRFFVEDIMRRIILSATADPDVITCTGCAFRDARGTQKGLVIAFVVIVSGAGALLMAISIAWTYTKHTVQQHINSIDIAQLPIVSKNVREQVLESLKPNDDVQFSANIGIRPDGPADEEEVPDADVAVGLASGNSRAESLTESHLRRKTFVGSLQRRSLLGVPESTNSRLSVIGSIKE